MSLHLVVMATGRDSVGLTFGSKLNANVRKPQDQIYILVYTKYTTWTNESSIRRKPFHLLMEDMLV